MNAFNPRTTDGIAVAGFQNENGDYSPGMHPFPRVRTNLRREMAQRGLANGGVTPTQALALQTLTNEFFVNLLYRL